MRIVVVDDSERRIGLISEQLADVRMTGLVEIEYCDSADAGRVALREQCDLLVLDILIPKKRNTTAQAANSVELLRDVCDPAGKFIRPGMVFGITADEDDIGAHRAEFVNYASTVVSAPYSDNSWLSTLSAQVQSVLASRAKASRMSRDRVLITVHGIRTYGLWQKSLRDRLMLYSRDFKIYDVKYGFFDLLSFCIPYFRRRVSERVALRVVKIINSESSKNVSIVAHSFGTIIVNEALAMSDLRGEVDAVIFCGSPLPAAHDVDHVELKSNLFINDCGTRDFVLLAARLFLPGLGDAGRVGFARENSPKFMNRFFLGGHSLYFMNDGSGGFCDRNWVGALTREKAPDLVDERRTYFGQDIFSFMVALSDYGKLILVLGLFFVLAVCLLIL